MKQFLLFFLVFLLGKPCIAQPDFLPGYYLTQAGDSIHGFIAYQSHVFNAKNCLFRASAEGKIDTLSGPEITFYGLNNGLRYQSAQIFSEESITVAYKYEWVFLEVLAIGAVDLLFHRKRFFMRGKQGIQELRLLRKETAENGLVLEQKDEEYKRVLLQEMKDCISINLFLESLQLSHKDLLQLWEAYHACRGTAMEQIKSNLNQTRLRFGVQIGYMPSVLTMRSNQINRYLWVDGAKETLEWGGAMTSFLIERSRLGFSSRSSLITGLRAYWGINFLNTENIGTTIEERRELKISSVRLEIPILGKYYLSSQRKRSYFIGGLGVNTFLHWKATYTYELTLNEPRVFQDLKPMPVFVNLLVGGGQEWQIANRPWFFEAMYGNIPISIFPIFDTPQATFHTLQLSVGTRF